MSLPGCELDSQANRTLRALGKSCASSGVMEASLPDFTWVEVLLLLLTTPPTPRALTAAVCASDAALGAR